MRDVNLLHPDLIPKVTERQSNYAKQKAFKEIIIIRLCAHKRNKMNYMPRDEQKQGKS